VQYDGFSMTFWPFDEEALGFANTLGMLRIIATLTLVPQLPELMKYLEPAVDQWQTKPFAGGMNS
jgi:hypothetical protein